MLPDELREVPLRPTPHLVILGAGASRAVSPDGEALGRTLPLTNELPSALDLEDLLDGSAMEDADTDFEAFFSSLADAGESELQDEIERRLYELFEGFAIAESVTLYDRLVLSLRRKDLIATFNWDPLLAYAYRRNGTLGTLPALAFLHGNVRLGVCLRDERFGWNDDVCQVCDEPLAPSRLLYPVTSKDYSSDPVIVQQWKMVEWYIEGGYFLTIFGYSAPLTDVDARDRIVGAVQASDRKRFLQLEVIDPAAEKLLHGNLAPLVEGGVHYSTGERLDHSWLARHPRLTCEALFQATMMLEPIIDYRMPETEDLSELQEWARDFQDAFPDWLDEGYDGQG